MPDAHVWLYPDIAVAMERHRTAGKGNYRTIADTTTHHRKSARAVFREQLTGAHLRDARHTVSWPLFRLGLPLMGRRAGTLIGAVTGEWARFRGGR